MMTEQSDSSLPIDLRRTEDFQALLSSRGINHLTCPACGQRTWGGFANAVISILSEPNAEKVAGTVRAVLAVCRNCGYLAMFDRQIIHSHTESPSG